MQHRVKANYTTLKYKYKNVFQQFHKLVFVPNRLLTKGLMNDDAKVFLWHASDKPLGVLTQKYATLRTEGGWRWENEKERQVCTYRCVSVCPCVCMCVFERMP